MITVPTYFDYIMLWRKRMRLDQAVRVVCPVFKWRILEASQTVRGIVTVDKVELPDGSRWWFAGDQKGWVACNPPGFK